MTRLLFNYIAGGCRGAGLWCWNPRDVGWEVGEYALVDNQGELTDRARRVGEIADALQEHRFELWEAHNQPQAGVLFSWITDALYGRLALGGYEVDRLDEFPRYPRRAQIGASRALINEHVPYEYVTERDLDAGLADRYETIYLPHVGAFRDGSMEHLAEYVENGGRVVADMMCGLVDEWGRLFDTGEGSAFERVFGLSIANAQDAATLPRSAWGQDIEGTFADVKPTTADTVERFDPSGDPAVLENEYGDGSAAFIAFEASRQCKEPGNTEFERRIAETVLGETERRWVSDFATAYRLAADDAHHYLFSNGDAETTANVYANDVEYASVADALTGETVADRPGDGFSVEVPGYDGRWVRAEIE
jgi:beta-galactosidase